MLFVVHENQIARTGRLNARDACQLHSFVSQDAGLHKLSDLLDGSRRDQSHGTFLYVCRWKRKLGLEYSNGAKDLLDQLHRVGSGGGFRFAIMVGFGSDPANCICELVDRVSE